MTQNSLSELLNQYSILQTNAVKLIEKINEAVTSNTDTISVTLTDIDGTENTYTFPSFNYLKANLDRIDNTIKSLMGINSDTIVKMADGTYKRVFTVSLSNNINTIKGLEIPQYFTAKSNWFFENFLSPQLCVDFDISKYVNQTTKNIICKRIIVECDTPEKENYFDTIYKNRNDININELYDDLIKQGILFYEDEEIKELPYSTYNYKGSFDVINIKDINITVDNTTKTKRIFVLNKLTYDNLINNTTDSESLKIGDKLICKESVYEIIDIDKSLNAVSLKRNFGYDNISIGSDILQLYSDTISEKTASITIGFGERVVIFFKTIDDINCTQSTDWSDGVAIYTNELKILTTDGEQSLVQFYNKNVFDLSTTLIGLAKEKSIPSIYALIPDPPQLSEDYFKVSLINAHAFTTDIQNTIQQKNADRIKIESEIKQINLAIEKNKQLYNQSTQLTEQEKENILSNITSLINQVNTKSTQYSTLIAEINNIAKDYNIKSEKYKYRVRGFFNIPKPKYHEKTGYQEVIQFEYAYRYLSIDNKPTTIEQYQYIDENNQLKQGTFSPWTYVKSDIRKKYFDVNDGIYKWEDEDIINPEIPNINTIDIPISPNEKVEIKARSYSEAGYPINPICSEWSPSIIIEFPNDLIVSSSIDQILEQTQSESTIQKIKDELQAKNLDMHLSTSYLSSDMYISHDASTIASGFYDNGKVIDLYEKLKNIENEIYNIKAMVQKEPPKYDIYILDDSGTQSNKIPVINGSVIDIFAGYYKDYIEQLNDNDKKGAIIKKTYKLVIENTGSTAIELESPQPGGLSEYLPEQPISQIYDVFYYDRYKYFKVPINNVSLLEKETKNCNGIYAASVQSRQLKSQYLYLRYKNIGLVEDLYADSIQRYLLPLFTTNSPQTFIWNGTYANNQPLGNGGISDFCIHTDCPILYPNNNTIWNFSSQNDLGSTPIDFFNRPIINIQNELPTAPFKASAFRHSAFFNIEASKQDGTKQLCYNESWPYDFQNKTPYKVTNNNIFTGVYDTVNNTYKPTYKDLPDKLGFYPHDRYLIGKNTCGAYLYLAPSYFDSLFVDGVDYRSVKRIEPKNKLVIPIVFEFRMVDYYGTTPTSGKIGGDFTNSTKNLIYNKKLGIDIFIKNQGTFSFDISVTAKYDKIIEMEGVEMLYNTSLKSAETKFKKSQILDI